MSDFISFNEFFDHAAAAKFTEYRETIALGLHAPALAATAHVTEPIAPVDDSSAEVEFLKMREYVLGLYKDVHDMKPMHTFLGFGGNFVDCMRFEEQPTIRAAKRASHQVISQAPSPSVVLERSNQGGKVSTASTGIVPPINRGATDVFGKPMNCPEGRIPLRRVTIAQMARLGKFDNFFRKYAAPRSSTSNQGGSIQPPFAGSLGTTAIHRHAVATTQRGKYYGCSTWLNVWKVPTAPGVFNLSQLWMLGSMNNGGMQTIESGWQTFPALWGTNSPALFVYYNPNNYDPNTCGYVSNKNMQGFIQVSPEWVIGAALPPPYSSSGGPQYGMQMQWQIDKAGNWWLYIGSETETPTALGYFPTGLYGNGTLNAAADVVEFGGEVCSQNPNVAGYPATGMMGSGASPAGGLANDNGKVAFQKEICTVDKVGGPLSTAAIQVPAPDPRDANYSSVVGIDPSFGAYLFFGGLNG